MARPFRSFSNRLSELSVIALARLFPSWLVNQNPRLTAVRPDDQLLLTFEFANMTLHKVSEADPEAYALPGVNSFLIVHFQPQNITEQAFFERDKNLDKPNGPNSTAPSPPPVLSRMAFPSRLVFKVPEDEGPIALDLETLLQKCAEYELSVAPTALPPEAQVYWIDPRQVRKRFEFAEFNPQAVNLLQAHAVLPDAVSPDGLASPMVDQPVQAARSPAQEVLLQARRQYFEANSSWQNSLETVSDQVIAAQAFAIYFELIYPRLRAPLSTETSIEAPFRLIISPNKYAAWFHARQPARSQDGQVVELWHTRLGTRLPEKTTEADHYLRTVRAIWTRDWRGSLAGKDVDWGHPPPSQDVPFLMPLNANDRHNLVHLSANYRIFYKKFKNQKKKDHYSPQPVRVNRMLLSSLGAWLDLHGFWDPPADHSSQNLGALSVTEWQQRGTLGRDHYVKIVRKGFLAPFGHKAVLVKITERRFHPPSEIHRPGNVAYMRQRMFIIVRQPERSYPFTNLHAADGHSYDYPMPFSSVRITTLVTPNIDKPTENSVGAYGQEMFWPHVADSPFLFHLQAEDLENRKLEFDAPLLFIGQDGGTAIEQAPMITARKELDARKDLTTYDLKGQTMAFAASATAGDTSYETRSLTFSIIVPDEAVPLDPNDDSLYDSLRKLSNDADLLRAYPRLAEYQIVVPALKHLLGNASAAKARYPERYLSGGFTGNQGQVFAELVNPQGVNFSGQGERTGALVQPNLNITGLSRSIGLVGGGIATAASSVNKVIDGGFDPLEFFRDVSPLIFGVISLADVIEGIAPGKLGQMLDKAPRFITEAMKAVESLLSDLETLKNLLNTASIQNAVESQAAGLVNDLLQDYTDLAGDLGDLVGGSEPPNLANHFSLFAGHIAALLPLAPNLPNVPEELKQRLDALATRFQSALESAQQIAETISSLKKSLQVPSELKVRFEWAPTLKSLGPFRAENEWTKKTASLVIAVEVQAKTSLNPQASFSAICSMQNFSLDLIKGIESFIKLHFERVEFTASSRKKPDINVVISEIEFVGVLSFVQALKHLIPLDGFSDPPAIEVTSEGIKGGFSLALPNLAFGVFSLTNLSLGAGFSIPFIGKPLSVRFNFCERESPFHLTVSMFGGGGFFAITLDPHGVQILEAAFEFGAEISIDFGVASGGVSVMAGVYYRIENDKASLTGYFRLHGEVSVLGIISASLELYLELRYEFSTGKCVGKATLTIEVSVFMFSVSVSITCERKFAGSNGDPSFAQLMAPYVDPLSSALVEPWSEYCEAFA